MKTIALLLSLLTIRAEASDFPAGQIVGWGDNSAGQATGIRSEQSPFVSTGNVTAAGRVLRNAKAISGGGYHALALMDDGTVTGWGFNSYGQALTPATVSNAVAIASGSSFSLVLMSNGTVYGAGYNLDGEVTGIQNRERPSTSAGLVMSSGRVLSNVVAVAAGDGCSLALKKDGAVVGWGKLGRTPAGLSNVVAVAASRSRDWHDLALKSDGTVFEWSATGPEVAHPGLSNILAVACGSHHSLALRSDGTVFGWGSNAYGQATGNPTRDFPHSSNGIVTMGGQVLTNVVAIAAGSEFSLALRKDGSVVGWGNNWFHQTDVPAGLSNVVAIAAGADFGLALVRAAK